MEVINFDKDAKIVLETQAKEVEININKCKVVISDISNCNKTININDGELDYCYIKKDYKDITINVVVNGGNVNARTIDILDKQTNDTYVFNLNKENSVIEFNVATIAKNSTNKKYKVRSNNNVYSSNTKIDCFGISEDVSLIEYDVTSFIKKGAHKSRVNQNSKILLFDKESKGINNPILEIEENDVKANHGSSIGMIDEETLFYLTSRGIKESDARNLVSLGKINYLIEEVRDEKIKEDLLQEVIERV